MLDLSAITLLCVETRDPALAHFAIQKCTQQALFGKMVLITDLAKLSDRLNDQTSNQTEDQEKNSKVARLQGIEYIQAPLIKTTKDYSDLLLKGLRQYVTGSHVLIIQWDSFIVHPELWTNDFLRYDYIGAVWPHHPDTPVGNGGFSLRSVKLLEALESPTITKRHPEDFCICVNNKVTLENQFGIRFAPKNVAEKFAVERTNWHPAFGFHGFFNFGKVISAEELSHFLDLLPDAYLEGVDTYDLVNYLYDHNNNDLAQRIWKRIQFKWRYRKRYLAMASKVIKIKIGIKIKPIQSIMSNQKRSQQTQNDRIWAYTTMAASFALLLIWVVPNTILLRHVLLAIAFLASLMVMKTNAELFIRMKTAIFPLAVLSLLFIWVGIHYFFFSLNPELELKEITSLWVRTFLGFVAAIGLGISLRKYPELMKFFYFAVFLTPLLNVGSYFYSSYLRGAFLHPGAIVSFLFAKIETAYFGAIAGAVAVGNLIRLLATSVQNSNKKYIFLFSAGLILVMASSILSGTKNGVAIQVFLNIFLAIFLIGSYVASRQFFNPKNLAIIGLILLTLGFAANFHKKTSTGWNSIFADVVVAIDIDQHTQWQKREGSVTTPLNYLGNSAAQNTYYRAAYATAGIRLISMYPLGYGSINQSFVGIQKIAGIQSDHLGQIHSGWIDFGLAFGIPGLAIVFLTLLSTIYIGFRNHPYSNLVPIVICITLIPFCLIAETSYKQYFESLIFFIALSASMVVFNVFPAVQDSAATKHA